MAPSSSWKRVLPPAEGPVPEPPSADRLEGSDEPAARLVLGILTHAVEERASDIHLEPGRDTITVRGRIDGRLEQWQEIPLRFLPGIEEWLDRALAQDLIDCTVWLGQRVRTDEDAPQNRRGQGWIENPLARVVFEAMRQPIRLRRTSTTTAYGDHVALRIIPVRRPPATLEEIGLAPDSASAVADAIGLPRGLHYETPMPGLVLVAGPAGGGRTTTLNGLIGLVDQPHLETVLLGDPVEFADHHRVAAKAADVDALEQALEADTDVVVIDGICDTRTAQLAIEAVMGGRLVLATMAAPDAPTAIVRLIDLGIAPQILAASLRCVVGQQLVRRLCPSCCVADEVDETTYRHRGCPRCSQVGYRGRVPLFEVLTVQPDLRAAVEFGSLREIAAAATEHGMPSLREEGLRLVRDGVTSLEELGRALAAPRAR